MAYSYVKFTGNGATRTYSVPFPYLQRHHVSVDVNGEKPPFTWTGLQTIQLSIANTPAVGDVVEIRRFTPMVDPLVDFTDGATLTERDLDLAVMQLIYVNQETNDLAEELAEELEAETEEDITAIRSSLRVLNARVQTALSRSNNADTIADEALARVIVAEDLVTAVSGTIQTNATSAAASAAAATTQATAVTSAKNAAELAASEADASADAAVISAAAAAASAATAVAAANFDPTDFYLRTETDQLLLTSAFTIAQITGLQSALDGKAAASHTHTVANVTGLQTALDGKAGASHVHTIANVTGLQTALDGKSATSHVHVIADVTGLQTAIDGKAAASHVHTIANVTGLQTALDAKAGTAITISAGNGLTGGGSLAANRTMTLGTPSTLTATSTNAATVGSHTHAVDANLARTQMGNADVAEVGTYALMTNIGATNLTRGDTCPGGDLRYTSVTTSSANGSGGTWRAMGHCPASQRSLFLRIA